MKVLKSVFLDGTVIYRNELGELHREGGPAIVEANGDEHYYINDVRYRSVFSNK